MRSLQTWHSRAESLFTVCRNTASRSCSTRKKGASFASRLHNPQHLLLSSKSPQHLMAGEGGLGPLLSSAKKRKVEKGMVEAGWATPEAHAAKREAIQRSLIYHCPACPQKCARLEVMGRHLRSCCPDLLSLQEWEEVAADSEAALQLLERLRKLEEGVRQEILRLAFRGVDESGESIRREPAEIVPLIGLPLKRVSVALKEGMKAVPLVADPEPIQVVYEDDDLLAVNKPAGINLRPQAPL
eukprot:jgi/Botrbrau1/10792/Bobra.0119s0018.2